MLGKNLRTLGERGFEAGEQGFKPLQPVAAGRQSHRDSGSGQYSGARKIGDTARTGAGAGLFEHFELLFTQTEVHETSAGMINRHKGTSKAEDLGCGGGQKARI
jgi:hypothetical protein